MASPDSSGISSSPTQLSNAVSSGSSSSTSASASSSGSYTGQNAHLLSLYVDQYKNAISQQTANYNNILNAYGLALGNTQDAASRIASGYSGLNNQVQNQLTGAEAAQRQAIADSYQQQSGKTLGSAVSRGLGNTTVLDSLQRGDLAEKNKADVNLSSQMANLRAGYTGQFGTAGLGAQAQQMGIQGALGGQLIGTLGGYRQPLPDWAPNESRSSSQSSQQSASNSAQASVSASSSQPTIYSLPGVNDGGPTGTIQNITNPYTGGVSNAGNYNVGNPLTGATPTAGNPYYYGR